MTKWMNAKIFFGQGVSNSYLSDVMDKFTIQSTGKEVLEQEYMSGKPARYMLANTRHYSWPKGAGNFS
jgi:hypothetical protein